MLTKRPYFKPTLRLVLKLDQSGANSRSGFYFKEGEVIEFLCTNQTEKQKTHWTSVVPSIKVNRKKCVFEIRSRSHYYHVIIGAHDFGSFVCILNWDVVYGRILATSFGILSA